MQTVGKKRTMSHEIKLFYTKFLETGTNHILISWYYSVKENTVLQWLVQSEEKRTRSVLRHVQQILILISLNVTQQFNNNLYCISTLSMWHWRLTNMWYLIKNTQFQEQVNCITINSRKIKPVLQTKDKINSNILDYLGL